MIADLRVCFVGESFVAGVGDREHLGWVGRLAARTERAGQSLTAYNLGVRRETSDELLARCEAECRPRMPAGADARVVVSCGVNDTTWSDGRRRVPDARYVSVVGSLRADEVWRSEVREGDGSHPGAEGYRRLADLLWPTWSIWVGLGA